MADVLGDAVVRRYANIFAKEFEKVGLAGGNANQSQDPRAPNTADMKAAKQAKELQKATDKKIKSINKEIELAETLSAKDKQNVMLMSKAVRTRLEGEKKIAELEHKNAERQAELLEEQEEAHEGLLSKVKGMTKGFFNLQAGLGLLSYALTKGIFDFKAQAKFGVAMQEGTSAFGQMYDALKLGIDPELLSELSGQNRASVIAMGGVEKWAKSLKETQRSLYTYTLDLDESVRVASEAFETLRRAGIEPTTAALIGSGNNLVHTFANIQKMTGQTFSEINGIIREFVASDEVRFKLMSTMDQKRRAQMVQEIAQRHEMLVGLGMTADQAKRAGAALDEMAGKGPMDRFKRAAKLQAVAGAMGMGAEGARAADIMRMGRRASPEQQKELTQLVGSIQQGTAAAGMGDIGKEFMVATMVQKAGLDDLLGPSGPLSTALGEAFGPGAENSKNLKTMAEKFPFAADALHAVSIGLKAFKENPLLTGILGAVMVTLPLLATIAVSTKAMALGMGTGLFKKMGKVFGSLGAGAKVAGKLAGAGAAGLMVGKDIYDAAKGDRSKENTGALAGSGLGAAIGGIVGTAVFPGVGTAAGVALGAGIGNWIGELTGAWFDKNDAEDIPGMGRTRRNKTFASPSDQIAATLDATKSAAEKTSMETTNAIIEANKKLLNSMDASAEERIAAYKENTVLQEKILEEQIMNRKATEEAVSVQKQTAKNTSETAQNTNDTKDSVEGLQLKSNQREVPIRYPAMANPAG